MLNKFAVITLPENEEDKKKCFEELEAVASKYKTDISENLIVRRLDIEDAEELMKKYTVNEEDLVWAYLAGSGKSITNIIKEVLEADEN